MSNEAFWRSPETKLARLCACLLVVLFLGSLVLRPQPPLVLDSPPAPVALSAAEGRLGRAGAAAKVATKGGAYAHKEKVELWPVPLEWSSERLQWKDHNIWALRRLRQCLDGLPPCSSTRRQIVLLQAKVFRSTETEGPEAEIAAAIVGGLANLDLTYLFVANLEVAAHFYALFPGMIKAVIVDKHDLNKCWKDNNCIRAPKNPLGTPIQDLHELSLNGAPAHPFGPEWQLSPVAASAAGAPTLPGSTDELLAWVGRNWTALAADKLDKTPSLGGGLDFML